MCRAVTPSSTDIDSSILQVVGRKGETTSAMLGRLQYRCPHAWSSTPTSRKPQ